MKSLLSSSLASAIASGRALARFCLPGLFLCVLPFSARAGEELVAPLFCSIDLDVGQSRTVTLSDGTTATIKLLGIREQRDPVRDALRGAEVTVEVNGVRGVLPCATYHLPTELGGVRIDCPVIEGYLRSYSNYWSLDHEARLRIWPEGGPLIRPGTFRYPVDQRWGAASTLFDNEIGDGELYGADRVYYHQGFDFGGADRLVPVLAATDGVVVSARGQSLEDVPACVRSRYDVVYLRDPRGWYYRYSHFDSIDEAVVLGGRVAMGQQIGLLGKEGASGGWSHLHFELVRRQENGRYGSDSMYAFLHQVYQAENAEPVMAVARPQILGFVGHPIRLDGTRSWSTAGSEGLRFEWLFDDGTRATGANIEHTYSKPGRYRPILKVTDAAGNVDYDFGKVTVADPEVPAAGRCYLHAAYWPTRHIRVGDEVTFLVRSFRFDPPRGDEIWDFGDGSPTVRTRSDGAVEHRNRDGYAITKHRFERPGHHIVTVHRSSPDGQWAVDKLDVRVAPK
jgi:murein DD-endopeptidase MepM/ murein hydrolase activator NlpD